MYEGIFHVSNVTNEFLALYFAVGGCLTAALALVRWITGSN